MDGADTKTALHDPRATCSWPIFFWGTRMNNKDETFTKSLLSRHNLAILIVFASVCWTSSGLLAQEATAPALSVTTGSWLLEERTSNTAPHLMVALAEREGSSLRMVPDDPSTAKTAGDDITRQGRANCGDNARSTLLRFTSLCPRSAKDGGNLLANQAGLPYILLDDSAASGLSQYEYQTNRYLSERWFSDRLSSKHEGEQAPRPIVQLEVGGWHFPIAISNASASW